jgi:carbonic anhydrase
VGVIDELVANNEAFAAGVDQRHLPVEPSRRLAIVTCMDSRLDVFAALGLGDGEAHVLRNAGGVITDDVIRSLALSQRKLGTREVMLIHHDDCGLQKVSDDGFRAELREASGVTPAFAIESFTDVEADVRHSILRVRRSDFLPHRDAVRGFVYDVDTHALREVLAAEPGTKDGVGDGGGAGSEAGVAGGADGREGAATVNPPGEEVV